MAKKRIAVVVGTRPEAIKMAPVVHALRQSESLIPVLIATGQHREMLSQALQVFDLVPDVDLALMRQSQSLPDLTSRAIASLDRCFEQVQPDAVLVQGDTTSVLCAAMAAFYRGIPIGHVEAGLRTGNMHSPWPEEMNRRLVSPLCTWNFAPTTTSMSNLRHEQILPECCYLTGNTVVDALLWGTGMVEGKSETTSSVCSRLGIPEDFACRYMDSDKGRWILVTGHRRESLGEGIRSVCSAITELVDTETNVGVVFPCHMNPGIKMPVIQLLGNHQRIALIDPVDYLDMIWLMNTCTFIISDSGGIQEEAPTLGKPVLVTRECTERPEGIQAGTSILVGTKPDTILKQARHLLHDPEELFRRGRISNPFGDGTASRSIRGILESYFANSSCC